MPKLLALGTGKKNNFSFALLSFFRNFAAIIQLFIIMNYAKIIIPVILLSICSCKEDATHRHLDTIDSLCNTQYDSALIQIGRIDVNTLGRSDRMYLELIRGKAMNKAGIAFTTDSVMKKVVSYYDRHGSSNQRMLAHYVLGCAYRDMQSAPKALDEYRLAVEAADTLSADCDLSTLMRVHAQMAGIYELQRLTDRQEREDSIAEQLAWQTGDTLSALIFEEMKCNALFNAGEYEECIIQTNKLHDSFLLNGYNQEAAQSYILCAKSCLALKEYHKAKQYLDSYMTCTYLRDDTRRVNGGSGALPAYMGNYYLGIGKPDSAEYCFRQALPYIHLNNNALLVFQGLSQTYAQLHLSDSVIRYTALYSEEKERRFNEDISHATLQMASLYDYSVEQKISREHVKKASLYEKTAILLICSIMLIGYHYWKKNERTRKLSKELNRVNDKLKEEEFLLDSLRAQKTISEEALLRKEEQVFKLKGQIEYLRSELYNTPKENPVPPLVKSKIVQRFSLSLVSLKEPPIGEEDWEELSRSVSKYMPDQTALLNGTQLSTNEYRLCLLILCGFEPTQIDNLLGMKHSYSSKTRLRLNQKVFNEPGSAAGFDRKLRFYSIK